MTQNVRKREMGPAGSSTNRAGDGQKYIVTIGIDRYQSWGGLHNAVSDARGVMRAFMQAGFKPVRPPLLDEEATQAALNRLVVDELEQLGNNDSLVVFYAGHGHTAPKRFIDGSLLEQGFIIPVDGSTHLVSSWILVDEWLTRIQRLLPKNILIILDSCRSGLAIRPALLGRMSPGTYTGTGERLWRLLSRHLITATHANQAALDSGPVTEHSLFTGCLLETLTNSIFHLHGYDYITSIELGAHVQRLVAKHSQGAQTSDSGPLSYDNRGQMQIPLVRVNPVTSPLNPAEVEAELTAVYNDIESKQDPDPASRVEQAFFDAALDVELVGKLDQHHTARLLGASVLSTIASATQGEAVWAAWAARRGALTIATSCAELTAAVEDLLLQAPWMRALQTARACFATAARRPLEELDAAFDAHSEREREQWVRRVAGNNSRVIVAGWLISTLYRRDADAMDLGAAPLRGVELLAVVCDLAGPISILVKPAEPTADSALQAVQIAARLVARLPRQAIAVTAPKDLLQQVLHGTQDSAALSMARQGLVIVTNPVMRASQRPDPARQLWEALQRDPRTAGHFELHTQVRIHEQPGDLEVALVARRVQLVIEVDTWYRLQTAVPDAYHRDRIQDVWLQRAGFFVVRLLAEDIDQQVESQVERIAACLQTRTAAQFYGRNHS